MIRYIYLLFLLSIINGNALAADNINGKVYGITGDGSRETLKGANIKWLGTETGVISQTDGIFSIERTEKSDKLIISYIGYAKDTLLINDNSGYVEVELVSNLTTDEVVVSRKQSGKKIDYSQAAKTEEITLAGLQKAACCNLSESFKTDPTVDVSYSDAVTGTKQIKLLGLAGNYTQILTENMPAIRGLTKPFGLDHIPGQWMESISISKGASTAATGFESITGQINVKYKSDEVQEPLFMNLYSNLDGRFEANSNSTIDVTNKISSSFFGHFSMLRNALDRNGDKFLDKPLNNQINLMNLWRLKGDKVRGMIGIRGLYEERISGQLAYNPSRDNRYYGADISNEDYEVFAKNGYILSDFQSIGIKMSAKRHLLDAVFGRKDYRGSQNSFYVNAVLDHTFTKKEKEEDDHHHSEDEVHKVELPHKLSAGFSFQYDLINEDYNSISNKIEESVPGFFAEYTYSGIENIKIISGLRADFHNQFGTYISPRFHASYNPDESFVLRASAGKGFRRAYIFAENLGMMASSREFTVLEELKPEKAWNYGISTGFTVDIFNTDFQFDLEYFRTDFINQVVVDRDSDPRKVKFSNPDGKSYANSFQANLTFTPFRGFDVLTAYRLNDVMTTIDGKLREKPLNSIYKAFLNLAYTTDEELWSFDITFDLNGGGRLPDTDQNPAEYRIKDEFPAYLLLHGQISRKLGDIEVYIGGENLANYRQPNPIISPQDPFGNYFDASMIWAPITGRTLYAGIRMNIFK